MRELVESIAKALVDHPDDVRVSEVENGKSLTLKLEVHADDMGKVIGKQGRIAKAIRSVVNAAGTNQNKRINLEIG
ncbi:KH domain-containing protein [Evansella halocellulosilytica]|uniref:KH domain-containing protein n=1 Tax=Evansella halocellulosilytica TaxID=2011013 RepID=UPI000BB8248E|nr:KH domain-containing protein [Evansella halocellulosilytica]